MLRELTLSSEIKTKMQGPGGNRGDRRRQEGTVRGQKGTGVTVRGQKGTGWGSEGTGGDS